MIPTFIWDLDGTLLDSYEAILAGIQETYEQFGLPFDRKEVRKYILRYSVKDLLVRDARALGWRRAMCGGEVRVLIGVGDDVAGLVFTTILLRAVLPSCGINNPTINSNPRECRCANVLMVCVGIPPLAWRQIVTLSAFAVVPPYISTVLKNHRCGRLPRR